jgi:IS30 family transposase
MPYRAWNKTSAEAKARYFELIRVGSSGAQAAREVGVSLSCGSLWFIDAGSVTMIEKPISARFLSQDDRIVLRGPVPASLSPCGQRRRGG